MNSLWHRVPILVFLLTITFLLAIPGPSVRVQAVVQAGPTFWSPFGPSTSHLSITVYADFQAMFTAFQLGEVDITDWPVQASDISTLGCDGSPAPDFFCTNAEGQFGIFQIDINRHHAFLGEEWLAPRATPTPTINVAGSAASTCPGGVNGRFIVNLKNVEEGNAPLVDSLNKVSAVHSSGSPSSTVSGVNAVYTTGCLLPGSYTISTTIYSGFFPGMAIPVATDVTLDMAVAYNSNSAFKLAPGGTEVARALAHMIDKDNFILGPALGGLAATVDVQAPPAQGLQNLGGPSAPSKLSSTVLAEDAPAHDASCAALVSAYNCGSDEILVAPWWTTSAAPGSGWSGLADMEAACDHLVAAGFGLSGATDCQALAAGIGIGTATPACANIAAYTCPRLIFTSGKDQIIFYPRTHPPRRDFSRIIGDTINVLFGTPNAQANNVVTTCVVNYGYLSPGSGCNFQAYSTGQVFDVVLGIDAPGGSPPGQNVIDDWHLYSGSWSLGSTPDHLWALYNSEFSGGTSLGGCAGTTDGYPLDYGLYCDPRFDTESAAGQFSGTLAETKDFFSSAAVTAHRNVMTVPVFSLASRFVALNGWNFQPGLQSSLVQQLGHGWQTGFWSLLNMRQRPGYVPSNPIYTPGGGNPDLIRRGFSQEVHKLSLFHGLTLWDFEVMEQIYDSMLAVNPRTGGAGAQVIEWMTTSHSQTFSASEVCTLPDGSSFVGCTTQTWRLRNDIKFHNGAAVTADDVCFSILAFRDITSQLHPATTVSSCRVINSRTLQVKHILQSAYYELITGGTRIIPASIWGPLCNWPGALHDSTTIPAIWVLQASQCGNPAFDPMQAGIMIGSGPWMCVSDRGNIGGPCTTSGTQDVVLGGAIDLGFFDGYHRCCPSQYDSSLDKISWADKDSNGVVNILDIADAALSFGVDNAYWDDPSFGVIPRVVDIAEIATVAFYFDHGTTKPFSPAALISMDPEIRPFGYLGDDKTIVYVRNKDDGLPFPGDRAGVAKASVTVKDSNGNVVNGGSGNTCTPGFFSCDRQDPSDRRPGAYTKISGLTRGVTYNIEVTAGPCSATDTVVGGTAEKVVYIVVSSKSACAVNDSNWAVFFYYTSK